LPAGYLSTFDAAGDDTGPGWGWATRILPNLDRSDLFGGVDIH